MHGRARPPGVVVLGGLPLHGGDREARGPGQVVEPPLVVGVVPDDADGGPVGGAVPAVRVRRRLPGGGGDQGAEDAGVRGRGHGDGRRELESLDPREFEFRGGGERVGEESLRHYIILISLICDKIFIFIHQCFNHKILA